MRHPCLLVEKNKQTKRNVKRWNQRQQKRELSAAAVLFGLTRSCFHSHWLQVVTPRMRGAAGSSVKSLQVSHVTADPRFIVKLKL